MNTLQLSQALAEIWKLVSQSNKYIDHTQPWILQKSDTGKERIKTVLYVLAECLRFIAVTVSFVMPQTPKRIFSQLNTDDDQIKTWGSLRHFGEIKPGLRVRKENAIFPRINITDELKKVVSQYEITKETPQNDENVQLIAFDDFSKIELRAAGILECAKVEKSDKLLMLTLDLGYEKRTVVSGIAEYYTADDLIGKQVVLLSNLKPAKIRGILSQGMILCAENI